MVVIDQAVSVILKADVVLHRERHRRPRVSLELRRVHEEVGPSDRLGNEYVVAKAPRVLVANLDLRYLLETISAHARQAREHAVETAVREGVAGRHGNAAALADRKLGHGGPTDVLHRPQQAFGKLRPSMGVREPRSCHDDVRFDEGASAG